MKINWHVRFKNKTFVVSFTLAIVAFIYQILGLFEIVPPITEDVVTQMIMLIVNMLVSLGVIVDPTTNNGAAGINDSNRALAYK